MEQCGELERALEMLVEGAEGLDSGEGSEAAGWDGTVHGWTAERGEPEREEEGGACGTHNRTKYAPTAPA